MNTRIVGTLAALALGAVAVGVAMLFGGGNGLKAGDCINPPDVRGTYAELKPVPCGTAHGAEVFYAGTAGSGAYDEAALADSTGERCVAEFSSYTGRELATDPDLDAAAWYPSEDEWAAGNNRVLCYAVRIDGGQLTETIRAP